MTLFEKDGNPRLLNPTDRSTEERVGPFLFYIKLVWTFDKGVSEGWIVYHLPFMHLPLDFWYICP